MSNHITQAAVVDEGAAYLQRCLNLLGRIEMPAGWPRLVLMDRFDHLTFLIFLTKPNLPLAAVARETPGVVQLNALE